MLHARMLFRLLMMVCLLAALGACAGLPHVYTATADGSDMGLDELMGTLKDKRVIFIGEAHTSARDHAVQMEVIRRLHESGHRVSIALEMFTPQGQGVLNEWVLGRMDEQRFESLYAMGWEIDYDYYRDLFLYARQHRIPLYGVNADRRLITSVARTGLGGIPPEALEEIEYTPCSDDPGYASSLGMSELGGPHGRGMGHLCDAQRLRDSMMAYNLSHILIADQGTIVVLLGMGHALKSGVPGLLQRHTDVPTAVLLSEDIELLTGHPPSKAVADFTW